MKLTPAGFEVSGRCTVCGYACDSDYATAEIADDLPFEFSQSMEACVVD